MTMGSYRIIGILQYPEVAWFLNAGHGDSGLIRKLLPRCWIEIKDLNSSIQPVCHCQSLRAGIICNRVRVVEFAVRRTPAAKCAVREVPSSGKLVHIVGAIPIRQVDIRPCVARKVALSQKRILSYPRITYLLEELQTRLGGSCP